MPKFAANLSTLFTELSFLDRFAAARTAGFDAVEFQFPYACEPEWITGRLARYQLQLIMHNLPPGDLAAGDRGMACDPRRVQEFQDMAGKIPRNVAHERAHDTYVANLKFAAGKLKERGLDLLIEPINDRDVPGYFLTGSRQAAAIIAECGADNLFLQYDIYHMQRMEGDLGNTIRELLPLIRHVQLADVPGRHEPGTGEINFPYLFRLFDELGYEGWIGCEYTPRAATVDSLGWRTDMADKPGEAQG
jgi:hydroxypyruvate isomerase